MRSSSDAPRPRCRCRSRRRSEEHTSELQSQSNLVCRLLLEKKNNTVLAWLITSIIAPILEIEILAIREVSWDIISIEADLRCAYLRDRIKCNLITNSTYHMS